MHLKYAEMLAIVVHGNMKLRGNTTKYWEALTLKHKISDKKKLAICSPYFTALKVTTILKLKGHKTTVDLENLKFLKEST